MVLQGIPVQDDDLAKELEEQNETGLNFFRMCLTGRLPESAKYLIAQDKSNGILTKTLSADSEPSIIFEVHEEDVIIEIMETYTKESWKYMSTDARTKENLLHFFIRNMFKKAITYLYEVLTQEDLRQICFQPNIAQKIPLMTSLSSGMAISAMKLWKLMEKLEPVKSDKGVNQLEEGRNDEEEKGECGEQRKVEREDSKKEEREEKETTNAEQNTFHKDDPKHQSVLILTDKMGENLLHMCSSNGKNRLLNAICTSEKLSKVDIREALTQRNSSGRTALDLCKDEETILKILATVDIRKMKIDGADTQGKNIFHHYAQKNFNNAVLFLIKSLPEIATKDMIFQQSTTNKSNVFMTCAIHGSGKTLELLLHFVLLFKFLKVDKSFIDMDTLLHHKNDYGNTLLSIILQSKDDLLGPKITLLGVEKEFHSRDEKGNELMCCFHKNDRPGDDGTLRSV